MKKEFKDKVIAIFGASLDEHGYYMDNMRRFIAKQDEKCYIVNRSIGGNYARLACNMVEDEVDTINPDVVFIHFGGNDVAGDYNANLPETEELLEVRRTKMEDYFKYMRKLIRILKGKGYEVHVMLPFAVNENIDERDDIETVKDNVDKAKYLNCKASLTNVNNMWRGTAIPGLKKIVEEEGVGMINTFDTTYEAMINSNGEMFTEDEKHYSKRGHEVVAKIFLEYLGYENVPDTFDIKNDLCSVINKLEQIERHIQFFRRWIFYPLEHKPFADVNTEADVKAKLKELMQDPKYPYYAYAEVADYFYDDLTLLREKTFNLIKKI